jgi:methionyl aminopeptidase
MSQGFVIAIEPMINLGTGDVELLEDGWTVVTADDKASAHWEHTIVIFGDHTEILTDPLEQIPGCGGGVADAAIHTTGAA